MKRAFEMKQKTFFLVSQVLSFSLTKQTSKTVVDTTFMDEEIFYMQILNTPLYLKEMELLEQMKNKHV